MTPQSPSKEASWDLTQFSQQLFHCWKSFVGITISCLIYFPESYGCSEISSISKVILVWGKARSCRVPNLCCRGAESPGWFDVLPKNCTWDVMYDRAHCCDEAGNHQLPIAVAFWIIGIVSTEECSSSMQNLMHIHCCTYSVILNATTTQYTRSLNGVYHPHWLVQWSRHCSRMDVPVHSPWLSGYIDVAQTILIILTMAGFFLDRPHIEIMHTLRTFCKYRWYKPTTRPVVSKGWNGPTRIQEHIFVNHYTGLWSLWEQELESCSPLCV